MKKILVFLLISISIISFSQENQMNENLFKTSKTSIVLKKDTINIDDCNDLIVMLNGSMFEKKLKKINFFKNIMDMRDFEKDIKNANINKEEFKDAIVIEDAFKVVYRLHRKFLTFSTITDRNTHTVRFILNKPDYGDIFIVEGKSKVHVVGISSGTEYVPNDVYDSMMNELVKYIKFNSKTYQK